MWTVYFQCVDGVPFAADCRSADEALDIAISGRRDGVTLNGERFVVESAQIETPDGDMMDA